MGGQRNTYLTLQHDPFRLHGEIGPLPSCRPGSDAPELHMLCKDPVGRGHASGSDNSASLQESDSALGCESLPPAGSILGPETEPQAHRSENRAWRWLRVRTVVRGRGQVLGGRGGDAGGGEAGGGRKPKGGPSQYCQKCKAAKGKEKNREHEGQGDTKRG